MSVIRGPVIRRVVEAARSGDSRDDLLRSVGLSPTASQLDAAKEVVAGEAYYDLLERVTPADDHGLPLRYATLLRPDDLGALGLGLKTASTARDALLRLSRYILVLSDTLEYELRDGDDPEMVMSRPSSRRGSQLANECAFGAVVSVLRQITGVRIRPVRVSFRHPSPGSDVEHREFFGCPVDFGADRNGIRFTRETLDTPARLADEGLSVFLLAQLDELKRSSAERSLRARVYAAVADSLPDGVPRRAHIARRLGVSERTLHRRLADEGVSFQDVARRAQLDLAEGLLSRSDTSLGEVAFLTGFADQSAFSRAFRAHSGMTPLAFRGARSG